MTRDILARALEELEACDEALGDVRRLSRWDVMTELRRVLGDGGQGGNVIQLVHRSL